MNNAEIAVNCTPAPIEMSRRVPHMATIKETAKLFGLAEHFIRQLAIKGEIVAVKAGCKYLVNVDKLAEYLDTNTLKTEQAGAERCGIRPIPADLRQCAAHENKKSASC